jgi:hypothetical protein
MLVESGMSPGEKARLVNKHPVNRLDHAFFNYLVIAWQRSLNVRFRSIRAAVGEGVEIMTGSPIRFDSHVQISIIDPELITAPRVVHMEDWNHADQS